MAAQPAEPAQPAQPASSASSAAPAPSHPRRLRLGDGRRTRSLLMVVAVSCTLVVVVLASMVVVAADEAGADVACTAWQRPSPAAVADPFRPPAHIGAPGNRGWEFATSEGDPIGAAASGVVTFAGWVAGRQYVTIAHCGGLRTSYSWLRRIDVVAGERVPRGRVVGQAAGHVHFGVRLGAEYLDPATLFASRSIRVRLVPLPQPVMLMR